MEELYRKLTEYILEWNEKINVTAIRDPEDFYKKNIIDSLAVNRCSQFLESATIMDMGTGGGFPGLPLAAAYPDKEFLLVDSIGKKLTVVSDVAKRLGLSNVSTLHSRAEDLPKDRLFDCVVSRAVAAMPVLCEYCIPFVKKGGVFIAYKTEESMDEIKSSYNAINILGGSVEEIVSDGIEGSGHIFVVVRKVNDTPQKYPRKAGDIKKKSL